jgi:DNA helicase-2/ATP-dependent DNA helicase PcrA
VFGDYQSTEPSRFIDEIPAELIEQAPSAYVAPQASSFSQYRASPHGRGGGYRGKVREQASSYSYEDEDQSVPDGMKPGLRVRHAQFGLGTIVSVEPLEDDVKLIVRFNTVGQKTLRAKFAKLEVA